MLIPNRNYGNLKESYLFFHIAQKVEAYREKHPDLPLYRLGIGDVSRPLCDVAIQALHAAVDEQAKEKTFHGYTPECGIPEFREAVAGYYARRNVKLDPAEIFVSSGASDELGDILDLFDPVSPALITQPAYPAYVDASIMAGRKVLFLTARPENNFLPLPSDDIEADLVYLCSPSNPTGAVYDREGLQAWVDYANRRGAVILFDAAYEAAKIALEHLTPVILLTDAFIANGSAAWKLPTMAELPAIRPHYVTPEMKGNYTPYFRDEESKVRYWAIPGQEGYTHIIGGLEKDGKTGAISTDPENHDLMCRLRAEKVAKIPVPDLQVMGDEDADLLIVGFGSTYGHLVSAMLELQQKGYKVAQAQFKYINPLPKNTAEVLKRYKKVVVAEQNLGQLAIYLRGQIDGFTPYQYNEVKGQPFVVSELVTAFEDILKK